MSRKLIVLIENDSDIIDNVKNYFEELQLPFTLATITDFSNAINQLEEFEGSGDEIFACIVDIVDFDKLGVTKPGLGIIQRIKEKFHGVYRIVYSAYGGDPEYIKDATDAGANWIIRKGNLREELTREKLLEKIRKARHEDSTEFFDCDKEIERLKKILESFHESASVLDKHRCRKDGPKFPMSSEYEVQDLLFAILKPAFPQLKREEWTPGHGGSKKRVDFIDYLGKIILEAKRPSKNQQTGQIGDALKKDIASYYVHKDCKNLICFVYDPDNCIVNKKDFEDELTGSHNIKGKKFNVLVMVRPR